VKEVVLAFVVLENKKASFWFEPN